MSTTEGDAAKPAETTPTTDDKPTEEKANDPLEALRKVLKTSLIHDGLVRGLRQSVKALDKKQGHLCVLAANCAEPNYVALVRALCDEHEVKLIRVPEAKQLGEWVGLCKVDEEGHARKVVAASCVVVKDFGEDTPALQTLLEYLAKRGKE
jgi:small subunit ribosomal protein S12e